jgi:hypothetical protein
MYVSAAQFGAHFMSLRVDARPGAAARLDDRVSIRFPGFMNTSNGALWLRGIMRVTRHVCGLCIVHKLIGLSALAITGPSQMTS